MRIRYWIKSITKLEKQKLIQTYIVGFILSAVAGWINAVGINLFLNDNTAFMSDKGLILGYHISKGNINALMSMVFIVVSFIFGAYISTILTSKSGLSGGLFLAGTLIILSAFPIILRHPIVDSIIISMAMGAQNAATSLTPINRTTHLTGPSTDIGINMARGNWDIVIFWLQRWVSFSVGAAIGFVLVDMFQKGIITLSTTLFLPAIIIISIGIIQEVFLHIPLLNTEENIKEIEVNTKTSP